MKKCFYWFYGIVCYIVGLSTLIYLCFFIIGYGVPNQIDSGNNTGLKGIPLNIALIILFGLQHSIMSRPAFKTWWTKIIPQPIERTTYILSSSLVLMLVFNYWQPIHGDVWKVQSTFFKGVILTFYSIGWLISFSCTFAIDHLELFGLRQVKDYFTIPKPRRSDFKVRWLYVVVRHPITLGWFIIIWITPHMTVGHLIFAVSLSIYNVIATKMEERDLSSSIGQAYKDYKQKVGPFVPFRYALLKIKRLNYKKE